MEPHIPAPAELTSTPSLPVCRLLREGRLAELAVCVIDELHMIRDPARGAALETSITKLLFSPSGRDVQVRPRQPLSQRLLPEQLKAACALLRVLFCEACTGLRPLLFQRSLQPTCCKSPIRHLTLPLDWLRFRPHRSSACRRPCPA